MSFEKQMSTTNNNDNDGITMNVVNSQWNVTNDTLAIMLHKQTSLTKNNNEYCVLSHATCNCHRCCKTNTIQKETLNTISDKNKIESCNVFVHMMLLKNVIQLV